MTGVEKNDVSRREKFTINVLAAKPLKSTKIPTITSTTTKALKQKKVSKRIKLKSTQSNNDTQQN